MCLYCWFVPLENFSLIWRRHYCHYSTFAAPILVKGTGICRGLPNERVSFINWWYFMLEKDCKTFAKRTTCLNWRSLLTDKKSSKTWMLIKATKRHYIDIQNFFGLKLQEDLFAFFIATKCNVKSHHNIIKLNNLKVWPWRQTHP